MKPPFTLMRATVSHDTVEALEFLLHEARAARRGLWVDAEPVPPWEWRKSLGLRVKHE